MRTSYPNVQVDVDEFFNAHKTKAKSTSLCHKNHLNRSALQELIVLVICFGYSSLYPAFSFSFAYTDGLWRDATSV
jgi:hypothetical protein